MKKIPSLFLRGNNGLVCDEVNPKCLWVFQGAALVTVFQKYDGTCCMSRDGVLYKRRTVKKGKLAPDDFELCEHDENTGKSFGWVPVSSGDKYHLEALGDRSFMDGTYELVGPKINGNPENREVHELIHHVARARIFLDVYPYYNDLNERLAGLDVEGFIFLGLDGSLAKIKKKDFGLPRKPLRGV